MKPVKERTIEIIKLLSKIYSSDLSRPSSRTPFQILIGTILAAQCTDKKVDKITPRLFKKYKTPFDFARAKQHILEQEIRSVGLYRNKARSIITASKMVTEDYRREVPDTMEELVSLPGVMRKTANIVLSRGFKKVEGIAVDTHVKRLSLRIGLSKGDTPNRIEKDLMEIVPKRYWCDFNYILVSHGRKVCRARKPLCSECIIKHHCPSAERTRKISAKLKRRN